MYSRLHLAALGGLLLVALQTPRAESRSSVMQVRVNVVRACSVDTSGVDGQGTVAVTCNRGTAAGVMASGSGSATRMVPVPARQTTVVSTRLEPVARPETGPAAARTPATTRQVVTVNF